LFAVLFFFRRASKHFLRCVRAPRPCWGTYLPYTLRCIRTQTKRVCPYCGFVTAVCRSFLLTSKGLHIPHLSKLRTNDKWWRDSVGSRSCNSHVGCCKRGGRELCTGEWSLANLPPAIYTIHPLHENPPLAISSITILNPGAVVVLVFWKVSERQTVERAARGPETKWTVADCHRDF